MTTCLISTFLGTSSAPAIPADDLFEQCPNVAPESVCQPVVTSGRAQGNISGKRIMHAEVAIGTSTIKHTGSSSSKPD